MKNHFIYIFIGFLLFCACNIEKQNALPIQPEIEKVDTIITKEIQEQTSPKDSTNFTDSNGLKQGIWKSYLNGKVWKIENYKNNLLDGKHYEYWANGEVMETDYVNGIKHGYFLQYHPDSTFGNFVTYWEKGKQVWSAFPSDLERFIVPMKGFITHREKVEIKVPYNSRKLMYQGTIISKEGFAEAIGIHKAYYETGELKAIVNYDKDSIHIYDKQRRLIKSELIDNWRGKSIYSK